MKRLLPLVLVLLPAAAAAAPASPEAARTSRREFLRGTLLQHRGDAAGALAAYEAALAADPDSAYLVRQAAEAALEVGEADKALAWARRLEASRPGDPKTHLLLGRVFWVKDDPEAARAAFQEALKLDSGAVEAVLALGSLLAEREPEQAVALLKRFLKDRPEQAAEVRYQLAKIEYDAGRIDAAIAQLQAGLEAEPTSVPLRYALAQAYEARSSTDAALAEYERILQFEPSNVGLIDHMAQLRFEKGETEAARAAFETARRLQPSDPFSSQWLATDAERRGDWVRAAGYLKDSSALAEDAALCLRLSYYHSQAGDTAAAVRVLDEANRRWPGNDQVAYYLALGYDDLGQGAKSVPLLRRVLEIKPDFRDARFQLGAILEKSGRFGEAEAEFRRILADSPGDSAALNYLGYSLADRGLKLKEAEGLIAEAVRLQPANAAYLDSLGWVHFKLGLFDQAVAELEAAALKGGQDAEVWEHLGEARLAADRPEEAWLAYRRAQVLAENPLSSRRKAEKLQRRFDPETLGQLYMRHFAGNSRGLAKLSALCKVSGRVGGQGFSHDGLLTYKASEGLELDLLGPLMTPIFHVRQGPQDFAMDTLRLPGLDPDLVRQAVERLFALLREDLSGELFGLRPARYKKGWRKRSVAAGDRTLILGRDGILLAAVAAPGGKIALGQYQAQEGRLLPGRVEVSGPAWSLVLTLEQAKASFAGGGLP